VRLLHVVDGNPGLASGFGAERPRCADAPSISQHSAQGSGPEGGLPPHHLHRSRREGPESPLPSRRSGSGNALASPARRGRAFAPGKRCCAPPASSSDWTRSCAVGQGRNGRAAARAPKGDRAAFLGAWSRREKALLILPGVASMAATASSRVCIARCASRRWWNRRHRRYKTSQAPLVGSRDLGEATARFFPDLSWGTIQLRSAPVIPL